MTLLNKKIRAIYAGALGALGIAVGSAFNPLFSRSDDDRATRSGISLKAGEAPRITGAPQAKPRHIRGPRSAPAAKPARAVGARAVAPAFGNSSSNQSSNSGFNSNQSSNSSSNQSSNTSSNSSSNSSSNQSSNSSSNQSSNSSSNRAPTQAVTRAPTQPITRAPIRARTRASGSSVPTASRDPLSLQARGQRRHR